MHLVLCASTLRRSGLAMDDAGIVVQLYIMRAQLETDLVISRVKVTGQHSVDPCLNTPVATQLGNGDECYPVEPLTPSLECFILTAVL
ncbi:hypothetical protein TNCV_3721601 [Trichonephila clavipes]|nr:hypothetical protein TNCV_3721601 [Trichonephila clavipes]